MKRLTEEGFDFTRDFIASHLQSYPIAEALQKLQAYENTGFTLERAQELAKVERRGTLIVLPVPIRTVLNIDGDADYKVEVEDLGVWMQACEEGEWLTIDDLTSVYKNEF